MKRPGLLLLLILTSMVFITGFQVFWIWKSYSWELRNLSRQLNMNARETLMEGMFPEGEWKKHFKPFSGPETSQVLVRQFAMSDSSIVKSDSTVLETK